MVGHHSKKITTNAKKQQLQLLLSKKLIALFTKETLDDILKLLNNFSEFV